MISKKNQKLIFIIQFCFFSILIYSLLNIDKGGAILWSNQIIFYFALFSSMILFLVTFFYSENEITITYILYTIFFCTSLVLIFFIGSGNYNYDLDSVLSIHSIPFILDNGYSGQFIKSFISTTYALPGLSILSGILVLITNYPYMIIGKYLPLALIAIFFIIYFSLIRSVFNSKIAVISSILVFSFPYFNMLGSIFANSVLAIPLMLLFWGLLLGKGNSKNLKTAQIILILIITAAFVFSHHLTYFISYIFLLLLFIFYFLISKLSECKENFTDFEILIFIELLILISFYIYIYLSPFETLLSTFTNQLITEGASVTSVNSWTIQTIIPRSIFVIFISTVTFIALVELKSDFKSFLKKRYVKYYFLGAGIFLLGVGSVLVKAPLNWDRIAIFGWLLFIPAGFCIIHSNIKQVNTKKILSIILISLLVGGNVYSIPIDNFIHSGDNRYSGSFKNWIKNQEYFANNWLLSFRNSEIPVVGDETVGRLFVSNSPQFLGAYHGVSKFEDYYKDSNAYLTIRNENFYQFVGQYYLKNTEQKNQQKLSREDYQRLMLDHQNQKIYDNNEVYLFERG